MCALLFWSDGKNDLVIPMWLRRLIPSFFMSAHSTVTPYTHWLRYFTQPTRTHLDISTPGGCQLKWINGAQQTHTFRPNRFDFKSFLTFVPRVILLFLVPWLYLLQAVWNQAESPLKVKPLLCKMSKLYLIKHLITRCWGLFLHFEKLV